VSNVPAVPSQSAGPVGLEDINPDELVMPKLSISHKEGKYIDDLTGERFDELEVVLLGVVKQRILWEPDVGEAAPLCKSYNHSVGTPDPQNPARFPWKASGFDMADFTDGNGAIQLPCDKCPLKEWGSHPKNDTPWCTEQHTFAVMMRAGEDFTAPAVLTLQRTGIKASRAYLTSFVRSHTPLFVVTTKLSLSLQKKGSVDYAVPILTRGTPTDELDHPEFAENYRRIRAFLTTPRTAKDDEPVAAKAPAPKPAAVADDDEMDF
jgi:hypothetical protein